MIKKQPGNVTKKTSTLMKAMKNKMGGTEKKDIKEWDKENSDDHIGVPVKKYTE